MSGEDVRRTWSVLENTAISFATGDISDPAARNALSQAAIEYAKAQWTTQTGKGGRRAPDTSGMAIPFGNSAGTKLRDAETRDLKWTLSAVERSIRDPEKRRWRESNEQLRSAIEAELTFRGAA